MCSLLVFVIIIQVLSLTYINARKNNNQNHNSKVWYTKMVLNVTKIDNYELL